MSDAQTAEKDIQDTELPFLTIKKLVKKKLNQVSQLQQQSNSAEKNKEFQVQRDALLAFSESTRAFIAYISAIAGDIAKENKRSTLQAEDVLKALEEVDCHDYVEPLKEVLVGFKEENRHVKDNKREYNKRRKLEKQAQQSKANTEDQQHNGNLNNDEAANSKNTNVTDKNNDSNQKDNNHNQPNSLDVQQLLNQNDTTNLSHTQHIGDQTKQDSKVNDLLVQEDNAQDDQEDEEMLESEFQQLLGD